MTRAKIRLIAACVCVVSCACLFLGGVTGCRGARTPAPQQQIVELRVATDERVETLDPHRSVQIGDRPPIFCIYDSLVTYDKDFNIVPELATSWEYPDDRTLVLHLARGVKFHDGTPFNADVVKWNLDRVLDPATKCPHGGAIGAHRTRGGCR